jgi:hypothetical protein
MEIKPNNHLEPATRIAATPARPRAAGGGTDSVAFERAQALDQALQTTQAVRPEMVARARQLISDVKYPPDQTIRQIAALLAMNLDGTSDESAPKVS